MENNTEPNKCPANKSGVSQQEKEQQQEDDDEYKNPSLDDFVYQLEGNQTSKDNSGTDSIFLRDYLSKTTVSSSLTKLHKKGTPFSFEMNHKTRVDIKPETILGKSGPNTTEVQKKTLSQVAVIVVPAVKLSGKYSLKEREYLEGYFYHIGVGAVYQCDSLRDLRSIANGTTLPWLIVIMENSIPSDMLPSAVCKFLTSYSKSDILLMHKYRDGCNLGKMYSRDGLFFKNNKDYASSFRGTLVAKNVFCQMSSCRYREKYPKRPTTTPNELVGEVVYNAWDPVGLSDTVLDVENCQNSAEDYTDSANDVSKCKNIISRWETSVPPHTGTLKIRSALNSVSVSSEREKEDYPDIAQRDMAAVVMSQAVKEAENSAAKIGVDIYQFYPNLLSWDTSTARFTWDNIQNNECIVDADFLLEPKDSNFLKNNWVIISVVALVLILVLILILNLNKRNPTPLEQKPIITPREPFVY